MNSQDNREQGEVLFYLPDRGYGFIKPDGGGLDVHFHLSELKRGKIETLAKGKRVEYVLSPDGARWTAREIRVLDDVG